MSGNSNPQSRPQGNQDGTAGIKPLSACHNAPVRLAGGIGDFKDSDRPVTMHYECTECGEPCDLAQDNRELVSDLLASDRKLTHHHADAPSNGGGSQDSIDQLKASIVEILDFNTDENSGGFSKDLRDYYENRIVEACLAWHNTQLYTEVLELIGEDNWKSPHPFVADCVNGLVRDLRAKAKAKWGKA